MPNKKVTELPVATTVAPTDLLLVVQGGVTKQVTQDTVAAAVAGSTQLTATYLTQAAAASGYVALAQIPIALDTDGVPYFANGSSFAGAVPVKTDTDGVPYLAA